MAINFPNNFQSGQPYIDSGSGIYYIASPSGRWVSNVTPSPTTYIAESNVTQVNLVSNTGEFAELDNWRVRIAPTGNRSLQIATVVAGNVLIDYSTFCITTLLYSSRYTDRTLGTGWQWFESGWSLNAIGNMQEAYWTEQNGKKSYRVYMIVGSGYLQSTINIQRLN
jgi:hypothetical protein